MKRACLVVLIGWLLPAPAFASPCIPGSLASYLALGGGGCNIGSAQFFDFVDLPLQGGAAAILDTNVLVNPVDGGGWKPGFRFDVNSQAGAGDIFERVIGFSLSGSSFRGSQLSLTGSNVIVDGAVTVLEKGCLGAAFAGQFCGGIDAPLAAFDLGFLQQLNDSMSFAPETLLGAIVDITVDGGTFGTAGLTSATAQFSAVPEPATLTLLGLGLVAGIRRQRRRVRKPVDE